MHSDGVVGCLGIYIPTVADHRAGFWHSLKQTYNKHGLVIMNM